MAVALSDIAKNKVLVAPIWYTNSHKGLRFTIVEVNLALGRASLVLQEKRLPKQGFNQPIGEPIVIKQRTQKKNPTSGKKEFVETVIKIDWFDLVCESQEFDTEKNIQYYKELCVNNNSTVRREIRTREKKRIRLEAKTNQRYSAIQAFEKQDGLKEAYFGGRLTKAQLTEFAKSFGHTFDFVRNVLSLYYGFGQTWESLIPNDGNCGSSRKTAKNAEEARALFPKGLGNNYADTDLPPNRVANEVDKERVIKFKNGLLKKITYFNIENLTAEYNGKYAYETFVCEVTGRKYFLEKPDDFLTPAQFKRLLRKVCSDSEFEKIKGGAKAYRNAHKALTSSVLKYAIGPSHTYEIDATVLDVYLLSQFVDEERLSVGRPILYTVVDVNTTMIVGFHLSLESPSAEAVMLALFNAFTDKEAFCKRYGYDYEKGDWPCHHVCTKLVIDRGVEYLDAAMATLIKERVGLTHVEVTEAYIGRAKGTVEGLFNKLNQLCIHSLPGALVKGRAKAQAHPSVRAQFTIDDLYITLIEQIIEYNQNTFLDKKRLKEHLVKGVPSLPKDLWNYGIEEIMGGGKTAEPRRLMKALLPREIARVNETGVELLKSKLTYQSTDQVFEDWRSNVVVENTKGKTGYEIEVYKLPSSSTYVWHERQAANDDGFPIDGKYDLITFYLADADAEYDDMHTKEVLHEQHMQRKLKSRINFTKTRSRAMAQRRMRHRMEHNESQLKDTRRPESRIATKHVTANKRVDVMLEQQNSAALVEQAMHDNAVTEYGADLDKLEGVS